MQRHLLWGLLPIALDCPLPPSPPVSWASAQSGHSPNAQEKKSDLWRLKYTKVQFQRLAFTQSQSSSNPPKDSHQIFDLYREETRHERYETDSSSVKDVWILPEEETNLHTLASAFGIHYCSPQRLIWFTEWNDRRMYVFPTHDPQQY